MKNYLLISLLASLPLHAAEHAKKKPQAAPQQEATVIVGGQVRRAGPIPYAKELTLYAAIQFAGGPTEFGSMKRVKIITKDKTTTYDLTNDKAKKVLLKKNDTIEVPEKTLLGQ